MSASVLGESWVVASVHTDKDCKTNKSPRMPKQTRSGSGVGGSHGSEQSTASSMSGPELIMPSIYETPISESSWVAPNLRAKQTSQNLRQRHPTSVEPARAKEAASDSSNRGAAHSPTTSRQRTQTRFTLLETPIRTVANIILLAAISHLLILPEIVEQYQSMCSISAIATLYPSSCVSRYHQPFSPHKFSQLAPIEAVLLSQTHLESLLNATLHEMAPLNGSLKQTESQLRTVEQELKRAHPGTKHELDLEFESCWRAIRIASWKFDSLNVDLQSAVDSLVAAGDVKPIPASTVSISSVAHDARLSTQMLRRDQYIEQLMTRMRSKADSLAADLATLDDHLESIENIVHRETKHSPSFPTYQSTKDSSSRLIAFVDAIIPPSIPLPLFLRAPREGAQSDDSVNTSSHPPKLTLSQIFHEATRHHPHVANSARNLSKKLQQSLQNKRNIAH
ncbi:hypothetical protein BDW62DRAFT_193761 [Aspergillus aurantiobrunneus]